MRLGALALTGSLLALTLKKQMPEYAMLTALTCGILLSALLLGPLDEVIQCWNRLAARLPCAEEIAAPLFKAVGISMAAHFAAELCRDSGQNALGAKVELGGTAACIVVMMPLAETAFDLIGSML